MINQQNPVYDFPFFQPRKEDEINGYYPYDPDPKLVKAVKLAIQLNRPLLLEGEPGCGKTQLAYSMAYHFTREYLRKNPESQDWWNFYVWNVKSNSQARDGLYRFDAIKKLRDAQMVGMGSKELKDLLGDKITEITDRLKDETKYVTFGKLGEALRQTECLRPIVLIDEIDKADGDFCNDLLMELERQEFEVYETNQKYPGKDFRPQPIIIITSNQERQLPEPFLRRCLYYYLDFPDEAALKKIIYRRFGEQTKEQETYVSEVYQHFIDIRELLKDKPGSKQPGTSEFIDFLQADQHIDLSTLKDEPHLLGIILKTQTDQELYKKEF